MFMLQVPDGIFFRNGFDLTTYPCLVATLCFFNPIFDCVLVRFFFQAFKQFNCQFNPTFLVEIKNLLLKVI